MKCDVEVVFLGTGGSCSFNNGKRKAFGTNTPCVAVKAGENTLIFDAGSGICGYNEFPDLHNRRIHLFLSHYHTDHISGLLFWDAMFKTGNKINIYGSGDVKATLNSFFNEPFSPVGLEAFRAEVNFINVAEAGKFCIDGGITIKSMRLSHPGGCVGYRVEYDGKSICYLSDIELCDHQNDEKLTEFAAGTDLLIADTGFANGKTVKGWGHSTPDECAMLAKRANVKKLALYHYNYSASDEDISLLEADAKEVFTEAFASADGLKIGIRG